MGNALNNVVFRPPFPPSYNIDPHLHWIKTSRNQIIPAFYIDRSRPLTLLFSHGNAEDIGLVVRYFKQQAIRWDCNVFAYEYSGYGQSSGEVCEANTYADIAAAYDYLVGSLRTPPNRIILYGRSLGSGPSVHLASHQKVGGLILQSPIASVHRVRLNPPFTLPGDMYANIDKIGKADCCILFIHGTMDDIVPFEHSKVMYNLCNPSRVFGCWIAGGGHNDLESHYGWALNWHVKKFLDLLLPTRQTSIETSDKTQQRQLKHLLVPFPGVPPLEHVTLFKTAAPQVLPLSSQETTVQILHSASMPPHGNSWKKSLRHSLTGGVESREGDEQTRRTRTVHGGGRGL
eukprot:GHVS01085747.1.p1 GENE.GHVS01085747.1~~GHVS01085747.1.p1  ORF type:complete len:345 (-),score=31.59 GHVS01085747.1:680-1714(-)